MEPQEAQELEEQHEHAAGNPSLRPVSFTISVLAVLVAIVTVLGHRSHTEAVLFQAKASDQWNLYQAKKIRQNDTGLTADLLTALQVRDKAEADKIIGGYKSHLAKWDQDLADSEKIAREFEDRVEKAERKADRFDLGEALLEIGLVITSITLLTRQRSYWFMGMAFGAGGIVAASLGFLIR
jgi:acyl-homoserine lactone acylase PvdQ